MKYVDRGAAIIVLILFFILSAFVGAKAQNVVLKGNTFVQQATSGDSVRTEYYYQDSRGNKYPIFLSAKGKAYAWVLSKEKRDEKGNLLKPAHLYKKYLKQVTEQLNKSSYEAHSKSNN